MINIYPNAKIVQAHSSNYKTCFPKRSTFSLVVIHVTSGRADPMGTAEMFATEDVPAPGKKPKRTSAHFVVGQKSEAEEPIIQCVDLGDIAIHAHDANALSVGVEHCAREPGEFGKTDPGLPLTEAQYLKSAKLGAWLARVAGIPIDRQHFVGHAEIDPKTTHSGCPLAAGWNWDHYMDLLADASRALVI